MYRLKSDLSIEWFIYWMIHLLNDSSIEEFHTCIKSTFLIFLLYASINSGVYAFIFLYNSMYSAKILNLNSYGCSGSICYSYSYFYSPSFIFFMYGCLNAM